MSIYCSLKYGGNTCYVMRSRNMDGKLRKVCSGESGEIDVENN